MIVKDKETKLEHSNDSVTAKLAENLIEQKTAYIVRSEDIVLDIFTALAEVVDGTVNNKGKTLEIIFSNKQKFKVSVKEYT